MNYESHDLWQIKKEMPCRFLFRHSTQNLIKIQNVHQVKVSQKIHPKKRAAIHNLNHIIDQIGKERLKNRFPIRWKPENVQKIEKSHFNIVQRSTRLLSNFQIVHVQHLNSRWTRDRPFHLSLSRSTFNIPNPFFFRTLNMHKRVSTLLSSNINSLAHKVRKQTHNLLRPSK